MKTNFKNSLVELDIKQTRSINGGCIFGDLWEMIEAIWPPNRFK